MTNIHTCGKIKIAVCKRKLYDNKRKGRLRFSLPNESYELTRGMSIQFDALLPHTYETLEETEIIIVHLRKGKRF